MSPRTQKILSFYRPYVGLLLADLVCAILVAAITLVLPLFARYITKDVLEANPPDAVAQSALTQIFAVGAVMILLTAIYTAANWFVDYRGHMMGALMEAEMRRELFDHYQKLSFGFYDEQKTGQLMSRLTTDLFWLAEAYHHGPEDFTIGLLKFIGAFIILFSIDSQLALVTFLFMPVMAVYAFYFNARMNHALAVSKERIGDINAQVEESLAGIRVVKSFTNEAVEREKFRIANERFVQSRSDGYKSEAYFSEGMLAFAQIITIAVIVIGGASILNGRLDLPDLLTFTLIVGILIDPIQRFTNFARVYQEGITGFNRFMEIMDIEPDIQDAPGAVELKHVEGNITFRNVSFRYREDHNYVVKDISLDIRAGEYVALVGASGVGKTTLFSLLPRFYEISGGEIRIDGQNIKDLTLSSLRRQIGIVQQDVFLFGATIAENIRYGKLDATMDEVIEAAKQANVHEFIAALPDGYETNIGQRGVKLSGGQKQRLSIARMFLKDPPIIILDEATSALDNESEQAVRESLEKLASNRTTLVIAHRLSTIRMAGRIIVLTEDGIEEQGTHEELIASDGTYASLYNMQYNS